LVFDIKERIGLDVLQTVVVREIPSWHWSYRAQGRNVIY